MSIAEIVLPRKHIPRRELLLWLWGTALMTIVALFFALCSYGMMDYAFTAIFVGLAILMQNTHNWFKMRALQQGVVK